MIQEVWRWWWGWIFMDCLKLWTCNDDGVVKLPMPPPYTLNHEHLVVLGLQKKHMLPFRAHNSQIIKAKKLHHKGIHMCVIHCSLTKRTKKNKKTHGLWCQGIWWQQYNKCYYCSKEKKGGVNKILMMQMLQWGSQCHFSPQVANVGAFYIIVVEMFLRLLWCL